MPKENRQFIPPRGWNYVQIGVNFVKQPIVHLRGKALKQRRNQEYNKRHIDGLVKSMSSK